MAPGAVYCNGEGLSFLSAAFRWDRGGDSGERRLEGTVNHVRPSAVVRMTLCHLGRASGKSQWEEPVGRGRWRALSM